VKAPRFWQQPPGLAAALLTPAASLWTAATRRRLARGPGIRAGVPVVCVGNINVGGTGKTPVVQDLLARLQGRGLAAASLSRGHGGRLPGPLRVDPTRHTAAEVGDEPLMLAATAPPGAAVWIARDRAAGARAAVSAGVQALVLDDGFQNPALYKDLSLVVVDGTAGFGNGRVMPAGPLREPLADGLARATAVVLMGADRAGVATRIPSGLPLLRAWLEPEPETAALLRGRAVMAFAGIGRPGKFFATLTDLGAAVMQAVPFPDHHPYTEGELDPLLDRAEAAGLLPVTTVKDWQRLPGNVRGRVRVLPVRLVWQDGPALDRLLAGLPPRP